MREGATGIMPDYHGGGVVNLMASIMQALNAADHLYPPVVRKY